MTGASFLSGRVCIWVGGWQFSAGHLWRVGTDQAVGPWGAAGRGAETKRGFPAPREAGAPVRSSLRALPTFPLPSPPRGLSHAASRLSRGQDCVLFRSAGGPSLPEPKDPGLSRAPAPAQELEGTPWAWRPTPESSPGKRGLSKLAPIQLAPIPHPYIWPSSRPSGPLYGATGGWAGTPRGSRRTTARLPRGAWPARLLSPSFSKRSEEFLHGAVS